MKLNFFYTLFILIFLSGCIGQKAQINETGGSLSISKPSALDTSTSSITYTVTYKNAKEITLESSDIEVIKTGSVTGTASVTGDGLQTRTVTVSGISGVGTLAIKIAAGSAIFGKSKKASAAGPSASFSAVNLAPAITISGPDITRTKNGPVVYTVTYSGASGIYLDASYINLITDDSASGTVAVTGTGAVKTVTISSITGEGNLSFSINASSAVSSTGVYSAATAASASTFVDITPPTITYSSPSSTVSKAGPVTYLVSYSDAASISLVAGNVTLNTTGTASGVVSVLGSGTSSRTVSIGSITGDGTLGISLAANTALDAAGNSALLKGASTTFTVDNTAPTMSISAPSLTSTNTGPITYTVIYTGASFISLSASDIVLQKTGTADATVSISGSGSSSRTVTLSSITGDGTLGFSINADTAVDAAGNSALASSASSSFTVDNTTTGISFSAPSLSATNSTAVTYTVSYTDAASISLSASDVILVTTGTATATAAISGTGLVSRTITLNSITGNGTIAIKLAAGTAVDSLGNVALASATTTSFTVDNIEPIITISSASASLTNSGPITYTVTYSGASAITLVDANVTLNTTGTATGTATVTGAGTTTRTVTISGITGDGTLGISLAAGTAVDNVGNLSVASAASPLFTVDNTAPTIAVGTPSRLATTTSSVVFPVTYSGAASISLVSGNVTLVTTGTATGTISVSGTGLVNRNVTISGISGNGTLGVTVGAATALDTAGNAALASSTSTTVYVIDDPLFAQSWHLYNVGQTAYSASAGTPGIDLNLITSWKNNYKGSGIKILVSDTGVESAHPDLSANFLGGSVSHDFVNGTGPNYYYATAEPILANTGSSHGTSVAGIIAAVAGNALGGQGIAPSASISSANILESGYTLNEMLAQLDSTFDIINQSWGVDQCTVTAPVAAYEAKLAADRKNYVKSAGSDFDIDMSLCAGSALTRHGNSVFDFYNNNPYTIVVGSVNASGVKSATSSPGSNIWISGLGGESGVSYPGVLSTDLTGCTYGTSPNDNVNSFQLASHVLNTSCNYTSSMSSVSAATPSVSGAVALLLSANGTLTSRDVKHILASTATKVFPGASATSNNYVTSPTGHVWQQGWVTNAAGFSFHNNYGFGLVNVDAAIAMATNSYSLLAAETQTGYGSSGAVNLAIPDYSATGVESSITVAANLTVEAIQIKTSVTHANLGQLGIELTSPSGTKSIIVNINNSLEGKSNLSTEVFLTNAFYGESSAGIWKVKLLDGASGTTGQLNSWQINVVGH